MARLNVTSSQELSSAASPRNLSNLNLRAHAQAQLNQSVENVQLLDHAHAAALQLSQQQQLAAAAADMRTSAEHLPQQPYMPGVYDVSPLYINSVNSTPQQHQQFTQQQLLESGLIAQQYLNQPGLLNQTSQYFGSGNVGPSPQQQMQEPNSVNTVMVDGSVQPTQYSSHGNVSAAAPAAAAQYHHVQYANLPALPSDGGPGTVVQYGGGMVAGAPGVSLQQQYDDMMQAQYVARQQQQQQYADSNNPLLQQQQQQQQNDSPSDQYNDETDSVDTAVVNNQDTLMTSPLSSPLEQQHQQQRLQAPPSYHPLLGAHYGQPVVSTDYYASRGLDDDAEDESAAGDDDDGVGDAGDDGDGGQYEHVYQNLPHTAGGTVYDKKIPPNTPNTMCWVCLVLLFGIFRIARMVRGMKTFPDGFLWGTATAA